MNSSPRRQEFVLEIQFYVKFSKFICDLFISNNLTHIVAEVRLDDFRLSRPCKTQISRVGFHEPNFFYPSKRLLQHMNLTDCNLISFELRKKSFLTGRFANFDLKIEFKGLLKFKMTLKIPQTFMLC